jgi:hypothetical protein
MFTGDGDDDALGYPAPAVTKKTKKQETQKYFVLTTDEVYAAKIKYQEDKKQKEI